MKNFKLLIAAVLAASSLIACSKDKGGGTAAGACQAGYVTMSEQQLMQMGGNIPQSAYYVLQTNQVQQPYNPQNPNQYNQYGQQYCVQQAYAGGGGNSQYCMQYPNDPSCYNQGGGNSQYCLQYPQDPSCYNQGGGYHQNPCQQNPYAYGCNGGGGYYQNPCQYNPYAYGCYGGGGYGGGFYIGFGW